MCLKPERSLGPLSVSYTHSMAEARTDAADRGVLEGDTLASVPNNSLSLRLGAQVGSRWDNYAVVKYVDEMCVEIGCNREASNFAQTESFFVVDVGTRYALTDAISAFVKVENAFGERAVVSRQPDGSRPNKPLTAMLGVEWIF